MYSPVNMPKNKNSEQLYINFEYTNDIVSSNLKKLHLIIQTIEYVVIEIQHNN